LLIKNRKKYLRIPKKMTTFVAESTFTYHLYDTPTTTREEP
jgi:hypothetical protein